MMQPIRPSIRETLLQLVGSDQFGIPGVAGLYLGEPKVTIVINACTYGTELNGIRAIQRIQLLAESRKITNARFFFVVAHPAAAISGVDHFGNCLNRLPSDYMTAGGVDCKRAAALASFFADQKVDYVYDLQENLQVSSDGMIVDIDGTETELQRVCDSLPCTERLRGIMQVQQSERGSGTMPFAIIYGVQAAAIEVLLPAESRNDGSAEYMADTLLLGHGLLAPTDRGSIQDNQHVYHVKDAFCGKQGGKYMISVNALMDMYYPVNEGDVLAVDCKGTDHIVARTDGELIFGPKDRCFTGTGNEVWWQVQKGATRNRIRRHADV